ncbi:MAG TPA: hypothetical protein VG897_09470 [Terriglobales bacterium]|nr:hypothetical protein [Terriglobales bacterium]
MQAASIRSSLPALTTIVMCCLVQAVEQGFQIGAPRTFEVSAGRFSTAIVLNLGLLCCLPLIGVAGTILSKRLGYCRKATLTSVFSPVALVSAMLLTLLVIDLVTTRALISSIEYSSGILLGWVVIPSGALLIGCYAGWRLTPDRPWYMRCL